MVNKWILPRHPEASFGDQLRLCRPQISLDEDFGLDALPPEELFANIDVVSGRIRKALFNNEPLVIFGHDDPDGITSTLILYQFFNSCGYQKHHYYIPNRLTESHGIQDSFVDYVAKNRLSLAITVDNGIASFDGVERLKTLGCETLIIDHHLIQPDQLPNACSILNPQLANCGYPFKSLAGVGVVLMLIRYLARMLEHDFPDSFYFWTAVGSIADKVPMIGLNRIIVRHVMQHWSRISDPSIEFLMRNFSRIGTDMELYNFLVYTARLIANGREDGGQHKAMRFLLQMGDEKAVLFQELETLKKNWEGELNRVFGFVDTISSGFEGNSFIYFDDEDMIPYHLLGTAASYVVSSFGVPTIMLKHHNGNLVCEGRCADGFNMVDAFDHCKALLMQFGGHPRAAGFTMDAASYDAFLECYNEFLDSNLFHHKPQALQEIDIAVKLEELNKENWELMERLLPYGIGNREPLLLLRKKNPGSLSPQFQLEYNSVNLPSGDELDLVFRWKSPGSIRVMGNLPQT